MRTIAFFLKIGVVSYLTYLLVFLATAYDPASPSYQPPFVIWVLDTINLFIHEAGHFFLKPFGMWIHIVGGSLFQCLLPLLLLLVTRRQNVSQVLYPAFWLGENLINVSVYIKDAPYRQLKLIARGVIHDWNWLLSSHLDSAEPLGETLFWIGLLVCAVAIVAGIHFAIKSFRHSMAG
ncbi:MAG: hypothetical protein HY708_06200 [Ignavibacteriae bacterium]|nr:hypothetical protein [Ignavibacteriota bacterium]